MARHADAVEEEARAQLALEEIARAQEILPSPDEIEARTGRDVDGKGDIVCVYTFNSALVSMALLYDKHFP